MLTSLYIPQVECPKTVMSDSDDYNSLKFSDYSKCPITYVLYTSCVTYVMSDQSKHKMSINVFGLKLIIFSVARINIMGVVY